MTITFTRREQSLLGMALHLAIDSKRVGRGLVEEFLELAKRLEVFESVSNLEKLAVQLYRRHGVAISATETARTSHTESDLPTSPAPWGADPYDPCGLSASQAMAILAEDVAEAKGTPSELGELGDQEQYLLASALHALAERTHDEGITAEVLVCSVKLQLFNGIISRAAAARGEGPKAAAPEPLSEREEFLVGYALDQFALADSERAPAAWALARKLGVTTAGRRHRGSQVRRPHFDSTKTVQ